MKIKVQLDDHEPFEIEFVQEAIDLVRFNFNPSGLQSVNIIKSLTVGLMSYVSKLPPEAYLEKESAIEAIQTASMWSVLAATKEVK